MNEYMKETNEALLHTYNQFPVVLERGEGAYLYDTEGKKYLDFAAGYAVSSLGYADKELNDALKEQIDKIFHTSNLYYNTACGKAAEDLKRITGMDRIFFTNSGGEAVEGTLKAARKYAYKKGTGKTLLRILPVSNYFLYAFCLLINKKPNKIHTRDTIPPIRSPVTADPATRIGNTADNVDVIGVKIPRATPNPSHA